MNSSSTMTMRDKLYMPPLEKYAVYSRFPWKIALHLVLLVLITSQLILVLNKNAMYSLGQYRLWNALFLDKDANGGSQANIVNSYSLFDVKEVLAYVKNTVEMYYDVNNETLADYDYLYKDGLKKPPLLEVEYLDSTAVSSGRWGYDYELTRTDLGPIAAESIKRFLKEVRSFSVKFTLSHHLPEKLNLFATCYEWDIRQMYDFGNRGVINVSMDPVRKRCKSSVRNSHSAGFLSGYLWLSISVAALSLLNFTLTWSSLMRRAVIVADLKGKNVHASTAWEYLDFATKLKFFNFWVVIAIIGNLCQFFGALCHYFDDEEFIKTQETLTGFGCFFAWVTTVGYLQHNSVAYTIINTLKRALPVTIPFVIGMFPIFMAYAFLGVALFWSTGYFPDPMMSMVVLFALLNGDTVYGFSSAMASTYFFLGQLYHFTFLVFFIWYSPGSCVHNTIMALVNEGFNSIGFKPIKRGDESDEEDDDPNFRSEMYQNRPTFPQKKVSDRDIDQEHNRMQAVFALKHILTKDLNEQKKENTVKLQTEMNWVATQVRDLLYDLKAALFRDPTAQGDVLEQEALDFLETELASLVRAE